MKYVHLILLLGFSSLLYAQTTVSGIITNENNMPVFGAEIYIEQLHIGTTSNADGSYTLKNIPKGNQTLTISFIGYDTENRSFLSGGENTEINIVLSPSIFHMDEVILSAPFGKLQSENVMKIESNSIETLQKTGAPTLAESLTSIPGVEQLSTGTGIGKPVIRGLSGNRVLIYTQGVRLENQQWGDEHGLGLNGAGFESVEVIKGPASLLYGSDALGGVLYINPEKFAYQNETDVSINQDFYSNTLGSNTSAGVKTSSDVFKVLLRGTYTTHSDYETGEGERVTNTRFNEKDFKAGFGVNIKNVVSELRYNYVDSKIGIPEGIEEQTESKTPELPYQKLQSHILGLHNHFFLNEAKIDVNLGYVFNNRREFEDEHGHEGEDHDAEEEEGEHGSDAALDMDLSTFTYEGKYYFPKKNKLEVIAGLQGLIQSNKNSGEEILIPDANTKDIGFFTSGIYELNKNNIFQVGARFDHRSLETEAYTIEHHEDEDHNEEVEIVEAIDRDYENFTFSLGYKTLLFKTVTTRINLASGFRAPNLAELTSYGVHHGTNRFEIGDPDLESEQNFQTDLSLEYGNEHFEIFANGFYNKINDYIFLSPTGEIEDDASVFIYEQSDADLFGAEFGIHLHPHPLDWLHLESTFSTVTGKQADDKYLPLIPANKWANVVRAEFNGINFLEDYYFSFEVDSFFAQNKVSDFETPTDAYNLLGLSLGGNMKFKKVGMRANLNINNLLDESYISHLSALKVDQIQNPGRNIVLGLGFVF